MLIGIDGNEANVQRRVGINEFAYRMLYYFVKFRSEEKNSQIKYVIYLKNDPLEDMPPESDYCKYKIIKPKKLWTQIGLPLSLFLARPRPDIFFSPTHYAPRFSPVPTVVSVMDLSYLYFPEMFKSSDLYQLKNWTAYSVRKAKKVITISNSTKNDIIGEYKIPEEKVVTVYPGIKDTISLEPHVYGMNQLQAKYKLKDNFILFVGTLQPRKNISRLIEAFSRVIKNKAPEFKHLQLVIIGKKGWLYEEILNKPEELGIAERVLFLESIPNDELVLFYKNALLFILPSLYEGFGLPVLEAMKYGCPVITSSVSSLPEAGGDAALYVDPVDIKDIAEKITMLVNDEKLRSELIEKGKKQIKKFNWDTAAKETLAVLREATKK